MLPPKRPTAPSQGPAASPSKSLEPLPASPSTLSIPRSTSPAGRSFFLTKPSKWFSRSSGSSPRTPEAELRGSRPSLSQAPRRPVISQPTDPRPILPNTTHSQIGALPGSKSVLDVSAMLTQEAPPEVSRPSHSPSSSDLRAMSRKTWSRSVDDLTKFQHAAPIPLSMAKVDAYRNPQSPSLQSPAIQFPTISISSGDKDPPQNANDLSRSLSRHRAHSNPKFLSTYPNPHVNASSPSLKPPPPSGGFTGLGVFPFHFGGKNASSTSLGLAAEKPEKPEKDRTSQIIHHSGFLNRFALPYHSTNAVQPDLSRGWKSYKAVLKGSKLYFYKPPNDRMAEVQGLFPDSIIYIDEDAESADQRVDGADGDKDREKDKRRRVYWGRSRHSDLSVDEEGNVVKGTGEALMHEVIFGTTFFSQEGDGAEPVDEEAEARWKAYSSATLLCLPSPGIMGRPKAEAELRRCAGYFLAGDDRPVARQRALWILSEYSRLWGGFEQKEAWEVWKAEHLGADADLGPASSSSLQAPSLNSSTASRPLAPRLHIPTPVSTPKTEENKQLTSPTSPLNKLDKGKGREMSMRRPKSKLWVALEKEGLTKELFERIEPSKVAKSLRIWHRVQLRDNRARAADILSGNESGGGGDEGRAALAGSLALFGGDEETPHWLTRLILSQLLGSSSGPTRPEGEDNGTIGVNSTNVDSKGLPNLSKTHARAILLQRWIRVGEAARTEGDECTWMAVKAATCCKAISRLEKVWRRVDHKERKMVEGWVNGQLSSSPKVVPWIGDLLNEVNGVMRVLQTIKGKVEAQWCASSMAQVSSKANGISRLLQECVNAPTEEPDVTRFGDTAALMKLWGDLSAVPPPKSPHINQYLSLSYAAEPRQKGRFSTLHWKPQTTFPTPHPLLPVLFPEPLPSITLLDRAAIIRGKKDSLIDRSAIGVNASMTEAKLRNVTRSRPHSSDGRPKSVNLSDPLSRERPGTRGFDEPELGDTFIQVFDGELVVKMVRGGSGAGTGNASRPASSLIEPSFSIPTTPITPNSAGAQLERRLTAGAPSVRISSTSSQLDRKTSVARSRRSSLPTISQRSSLLAEPSTERPVRVTVSGGTLDRLVDVLVSGLEGVGITVADDNGETLKGKTRSISVDRVQFARVWWAVFRSFVSPYVLFELLRKRYSASQPDMPRVTFASTHIVLGGPSIAAPVSQTSLAQTRLDVLSTIEQWFTKGGGAQDALDDVELYNAVNTFLSCDVAHAPEPLAFDKENAYLWQEVERKREAVRKLFKSQTQRPSLGGRLGPPKDAQLTYFTSEPPNIDDQADAAELVDNLDSIASTVFQMTTRDDFLITADILEVQTFDRTGWFPPRESTTLPDEICIQNVYTHLQDVEPSALISELSPFDSLHRMLPPSIRGIMRAHYIMRQWAISKIIAPGIGLQLRAHRIERFLDALEICRLRAPNSDVSSPVGSYATPIRSFVEAVISSALCSPESRIFTRAWQDVAATRGVSAESFSTLFSKRFVDPPSTKRDLTVDAGWLIERMLEIITLPDTYNSIPDGHILLNFDKRRYLANLVANVPGLAPGRRPPSEADRIDIDRMSNMLREFTQSSFDLRALRDEASRETYAIPSPHGSKRIQRPFQALVSAQLEKLKRDKLTYDRLNREKRLEQMRSDKRESDLNKAMQPKKSSGAHKHDRSKRSMSAFFRVVRPLSTAFSSSDKLNTYPLHQRTASELDFKPGSKPSHVLNLADARISSYANHQRSFTFQVQTEDGANYLLQTISHAELTSWMKSVIQVAQASAKKRLTYLGNKPQFADLEHLGSSSQAKGAHTNSAVYGVDPELLMQREYGYGEIQPGTVPNVIERFITEIETRGITEVGLYRIPGALSAINALREAFDSGNHVNFDDERFVDIHTLCGAFKLWFRELPEPIFPYQMYDDAIESSRISDYDARYAKIRQLVHSLPRANFEILRRLLEHLDKVTDYEEHNQMTAESLAICFGQTLLKPRPSPNAFALGIGGMSQAMNFIKSIILQYHWIFNDPDPEAEDEDEADNDNDEDEESTTDDDIDSKPGDQDETELIPYFTNADREQSFTSSDTIDFAKSPM
ncbi:hypothetical protein BOTBODRAFT_176768 [Botryobasidium botryosum FD-172 SS1]|uniref:Rho-GAP domain-containing protein n=1 Tax=Botryobasidium botryosum (strain FD-172 SS1) TaxID=930990 RepID=A0A067M8V7_BOTB1|nr:hypothetical protein BOTBODRAFT_176768 [Botryobasidium botryosum FD-172 SS1]